MSQPAFAVTPPHRCACVDAQRMDIVRADSSGRHVLVVDDDTVVRELLRADLEAAGFQVRTSSSAVEALRMMATKQSAIVITDWLMPEMDGLELCRRLRSEPVSSSVHVLMLTVNCDTARLVQAYEAGVDDFIPKPFEAGVLLARMRVAARIVDARAQLAAKNAELQSANSRLAVLASTDELTGVLNRREGMSRLAAAWDLASRQGLQLSVALLDIDHFKGINDTFGHAAGDETLRAVTRVLEQELRSSDVLCRLGGDEFLLILTGQGAEQAMGAANRCQSAVPTKCPAIGEPPSAVTVSIGVAEKTSQVATAVDLLRNADAALYSAKLSGRNACCCGSG